MDIVAETSDAANTSISEKNQCRVANEDVEGIVESSTTGPTDIDKMGFVEKRKSPTAGTLDIDKIGPPEKKIHPTAGTLDVDKMDPYETKIPPTAGSLDIDKMGPPEKKIPPTAGTLDVTAWNHVVHLHLGVINGIIDRSHFFVAATEEEMSSLLSVSIRGSCVADFVLG